MSHAFQFCHLKHQKFDLLRRCDFQLWIAHTTNKKFIVCSVTFKFSHNVIYIKTTVRFFARQWLRNYKTGYFSPYRHGFLSLVLESNILIMFCFQFLCLIKFFKGKATVIHINVHKLR